ncbi:hypothetical protein BDR07DRAFT_1478150 [Suillus spraguei]|nr:hypothetical protein BDR07DRAFT_1478150 [Suillus spraguei]
MQRVSDSVTSIFCLETEDERLATCLQGGSTIVYSEKFGLGWRFGLQYAKGGWAFAKVKVYLDHTHCSSATDAATVTICLKDGSGSEVSPFDSRTISIADFGHGPPHLLARSRRPLLSHTLICGLRQSMNSGEFADTKYYVVSKRKTWRYSGETRFIYASDAVLDHGAGVAPVLPSSTTENSLLVHHQSESGLMRDAERYDYDLDSDLEDGEVKEKEKPNSKGTEQGAPSSQPPPYRYSQSYPSLAAPSEFDESDTTSDSSGLSSDGDDLSWTEWPLQSPGFRSTDTLRAEPPPQPFSPTQRMVLVRNTAFATFFLPLKSKDPLSRRNNTTQNLRCSPKSMYRLALKLKNARLEALAFQAIKSSLSESNILYEAFSWFTAQYPDIHKMQLELLIEFRSAPEVSSRLERIIGSVSRGERPYAQAMLLAFLAGLTQQRAGGTQ